MTIFGQSGGGRSTQALACSPLAKGLVKHAIVQSAGGVTTAFGRMPREQMEQRGLEFMRFAGCENLAALRAIPAAELVQKLHDFGASAQSMEQRMARGFNISTDGYALPLSMEDTLLEGRQLDLDYMLGSVTLDDRMSSMMASHRGWATLQARTGLKAPYLYRFTRQLPEDDPADERPLKGAFHSSELWYTFGTLGRCWRPMTQADYALSEVMTDAWANFAKTGNPNGGKVPAWTPYTPDNKLLMRFDIEGMGMTDFDPDGAQCRRRKTRCCGAETKKETKKETAPGPSLFYGSISFPSASQRRISAASSPKSSKAKRWETSERQALPSPSVR